MACENVFRNHTIIKQHNIKISTSCSCQWGDSPHCSDWCWESGD